MRLLKAHVRGGRLELDEPLDLPEGVEVRLALVVDDDDLDDAERAALHASIEESEADFEAGRVVSEEEVWARLKAL